MKPSFLVMFVFCLFACKSNTINKRLEFDNFNFSYHILDSCYNEKFALDSNKINVLQWDLKNYDCQNKVNIKVLRNIHEDLGLGIKPKVKNKEQYCFELVLRPEMDSVLINKTEIIKVSDISHFINYKIKDVNSTDSIFIFINIIDKKHMYDFKDFYNSVCEIKNIKNNSLVVENYFYHIDSLSHDYILKK